MTNSRGKFLGAQVCLLTMMGLSRMALLYKVPNLIGRNPPRREERGAQRVQVAENETLLVPILHNGRGSPTNRVCPPEIQLVLVTKGIMDI